MAAAPKSILEIQYQNPAPPAGIEWWSAGGGNGFPLNRDFEWDQILTPGEEYDESLVGVSGWVINPQISNVDLPMTHPFVSLTQEGTEILGDWEFGTFVDDQYFDLVSEANGYSDEGDGSTSDPDIDHVINDLHLPWPVDLNGLLGVEIESGLVPERFRERVQDGDRVAMFGRWIVDQGHPNKVYDAYRAEIHPPLVMATGNVQSDARGHLTRVLFMSRPYLPGQKFTTDPNNAYDDSAGDDGAFKQHLINELVKVLSPIPLSFKVHFYSKIKSNPFLGAHLLHFIVRPPPLPKRTIVTRPFKLVVSFNFTVRSGCAVQVYSGARDQIDVLIALNHVGYKPPKLPIRREHNWTRSDLNKLSPDTGILGMGAGDLMFNIAEASGGLIGGLLGGPLNLAKVEAVLESGVGTDLYDAVPEVDLLGTSGAVLNAAADDIPAGKGIAVNDSDDQPFPVFGWLESRWVQPEVVSVP